MLTRLVLGLTLFVSGAAVMILEILGTKVISPFFGVGLYVWSALITVTLLSLSLGYWVGGLLADKNPKTSWLFMIIFLSGLAALFIPGLTQPVIRMVESLELRIGTLTASFLLFFIPLAGLGMVSPFAIRIQASRIEGVGATAGVLYAVSTLGSFVGTLLAGFVLIPALPVRMIFFLVAGILMVMGLSGLLFFGKRGMGLVMVFLAVAGTGLAIFSLHPDEAEAGDAVILHQSEGFYGQIKVVDHESARSLLVNGSPQNFVRKMGTDSLFEQTPYAMYLAALFIYRPKIQEVLMIGLGGGTLPTLFSRYGARADVIEIDPRMEGLAKEFFGFQPGQCRIFLGDGRQVMRRLEGKYDAFVLDAFAAYDQPSHLFTREMFFEVKRLLKEGGVVGINSAGFVKGNGSRVSKAILKTLQDVFLHVEAFHIEGRERVGNIIFFASDKPLRLTPQVSRMPVQDQALLIQTLDANRARQDLAGGIVLTDDYNPIPYWGAPVFRAWREEVVKFFGKKVLRKV